jgi:chromosomal replication initiator protein
MVSMDGAVVEHDVYVISSRSKMQPLAAAIAPAIDPAASNNEAPRNEQDCADFIVGPENQLTGSIILMLLNQDPAWYSPLVLYGPSGTGKSHLAQCVAQSRPDAVCTTGADFVRELTAAVHHNAVEQFHAKYRTAGLFVLDGALQLLGRHGALQELRYLLDALEASETPVLITSSRPPAEVAELPPALRSRLGGGLVVAVSSPGIAARQIILHRCAAAHRITLSTAAAKLLAEKLTGIAADLRGAITQLQIEAKADVNYDPAKPIGLEHARRFLSRRRAPCPSNLNQITKLVAKYYGLTPTAMSSPSRRRQVVLARAIAIYLGRMLCGASLKSLGMHFGGRDHSTALHNFQQMQARLSRDSALCDTVDALQRLLVGSA